MSLSPRRRPIEEGRSPGETAVSGTLIGFDFGERKIGVAVGETATRIANPLTTIAETVNERRFAAIAKLVAEWRPSAFVVGLPRHADDAPHPVARLATRFGQRLEGRFHVPVHFIDETLSSAAAESALRDSGARGKGDTDALAAAFILQSFLDEMPNATAGGAR